MNVWLKLIYDFSRVSLIFTFDLGTVVIFVVLPLVCRATRHSSAGVYATAAAYRQELRGEQAAVSGLPVRKAISGRAVPLGLVGAQ